MDIIGDNVAIIIFKCIFPLFRTLIGPSYNSAPVVSFVCTDTERQFESEVSVQDNTWAVSYKKEFSPLSDVQTTMTYTQGSYSNAYNYQHPINLTLSVTLRTTLDDFKPKSNGLVENLGSLTNNEELSDFKFLVGDKTFPVHKAIVGGE